MKPQVDVHGCSCESGSVSITRLKVGLNVHLISVISSLYPHSNHNIEKLTLIYSKFAILISMFYLTKTEYYFLLIYNRHVEHANINADN